jgi:predicted O-methyltransferase YrrM
MLYENINPPSITEKLAAATQAAGFTMSSDELTGSLLRILAASKPSGKLLELGTGTGMGSAWLLNSMDAHSTLTTVDQNEATTAIARSLLGADPRVTFLVTDGATFIKSQPPATYDLIFADTWPGKFFLLEKTLALLKSGGLYIVDDLLPQPKWEAEHLPKVEALIKTLEEHPDLHITKLEWSTGLIIATRK